MEFEGAGACQCGAPLAPLLGESRARRRLRGRRGVESAIWEKKERSIENHCHSETSDLCHRSWESVSFPDSSMFLCGAKENGFPRRFAQRDGGILDSLICRLVPLGAMTGWFWTCASIYTLVQGAALRDGTAAVPYERVFGALFLFSPARVATLATPSALTRHCLAAARSRRGSDMTPACHSLPRRRCTTLGGAALRGKDSGFCADLGSASRQRFRTGAWRRGAPLAPLIGELARRQP